MRKRYIAGAILAVFVIAGIDASNDVPEPKVEKVVAVVASPAPTFKMPDPYRIKIATANCTTLAKVRAEVLDDKILGRITAKQQRKYDGFIDEKKAALGGCLPPPEPVETKAPAPVSTSAGKPADLPNVNAPKIRKPNLCRKWYC